MPSEYNRARCSSRHRFKYQIKWSDNLDEDLLKALSNFKTVIEFSNKDFNTDKPRQYKKVRKEIVKINECCMEYFGPVSLPLFPSDMDEEEKIRFFVYTDVLPTLLSFFVFSFNFLNMMFGLTISE